MWSGPHLAHHPDDSRLGSVRPISVSVDFRVTMSVLGLDDTILQMDTIGIQKSHFGPSPLLL